MTATKNQSYENVCVLLMLYGMRWFLQQFFNMKISRSTMYGILSSLDVKKVFSVCFVNL